MYGIQTFICIIIVRTMFENDVKMYGIQTCISVSVAYPMFENDVKMYGIQTVTVLHTTDNIV